MLTRAEGENVWPKQCCGSGSGIRCLFDPWTRIWDPRSGIGFSGSRIPDPNQCCGSRMFIPDPDFHPSRIPDLGSWIQDPKTGTKKRGEKILYVKPFL
jgi:hypothetical protein